MSTKNQKQEKQKKQVRFSNRPNDPPSRGPKYTPPWAHPETPFGYNEPIGTYTKSIRNNHLHPHPLSEQEPKRGLYRTGKLKEKKNNRTGHNKNNNINIHFTQYHQIEKPLRYKKNELENKTKFQIPEPRQTVRIPEPRQPVRIPEPRQPVRIPEPRQSAQIVRIPMPNPNPTIKVQVPEPKLFYRPVSAYPVPPVIPPVIHGQTLKPRASSAPPIIRPITSATPIISARPMSPLYHPTYIYPPTKHHRPTVIRPPYIPLPYKYSNNKKI